MKPEREALGGILGAGVRIRGELLSDQNLRFDGRIEGNVVARGGLTLGREAKVKGKVMGTVVRLAGRINGEIVATEQLEILEGAIVEGVVRGANVRVEDGACVNAELQLGEFAKQQLQEARNQMMSMDRKH